MKIASPFSFPVVPLLWESSPGRSMLTVIVKITFQLAHGEPASIAPVQEPLSGDRPWEGATQRVLFYPSDWAPQKKRPEVMVVGCAYAPDNKPADKVVVRLTCGEINKAIRVMGDRLRIGSSVSPPQPFTRMPLTAERALQSKNNPAGIPATGVPNLEAVDPRTMPIFGPLDPYAEVRLRKNTEASIRWAYRPEGAPPEGFDADLFNAAPVEQRVARIPLGAKIALVNMRRDHAVFEPQLSDMRPRAELDGRPLELVADTLWIDAERAIAIVVFRGVTPIERAQWESGTIAIATAQGGVRASFGTPPGGADAGTVRLADGVLSGDAGTARLDPEQVRAALAGYGLPFAASKPVAPVVEPPRAPVAEPPRAPVVEPDVSSVKAPSPGRMTLAAPLELRPSAALPFASAAGDDRSIAPSSRDPETLRGAFSEPSAVEIASAPTASIEPVALDPVPTSPIAMVAVEELEPKTPRPQIMTIVAPLTPRVGALPFSKGEADPSIAKPSIDEVRVPSRSMMTLAAPLSVQSPERALPFEGRGSSPAQAPPIVQMPSFAQMPSLAHAPPIAQAPSLAHAPPTVQAPPAAPALDPPDARAELLPIEAYASIKAALFRGELRDEVLARAGLDEHAWIIQEQLVARALDEEAKAGRADRAIALAEALRGARPNDPAHAVPIERYVAITVALEQADDRSAVLRDAGFDERAWKGVVASFKKRSKADAELRERLGALLFTARASGGGGRANV